MDWRFWFFLALGIAIGHLIKRLWRRYYREMEVLWFVGYNRPPGSEPRPGGGWEIPPGLQIKTPPAPPLPPPKKDNPLA